MMIRIIEEKKDTHYKVKQKYPMVPTRDFITIVANTGSTTFTVYAGETRRRLYSGGTNGDKIISYYFDGVNAVITCHKRIFIYGPSNPKNPERNWHQIRTFPAH